MAAIQRRLRRAKEASERSLPRQDSALSMTQTGKKPSLRAVRTASRRFVSKEDVAFADAYRAATALLGPGALAPQASVRGFPGAACGGASKSKMSALAAPPPLSHERALLREIGVLLKQTRAVEKAERLALEEKDRVLRERERVLFNARCGLEAMAELVRQARVAACTRALRLREERLRRPVTPHFISLLKKDGLSVRERSQLRDADEAAVRARRFPQDTHEDDAETAQDVPETREEEEEEDDDGGRDAYESERPAGGHALRAEVRARWEADAAAMLRDFDERRRAAERAKPGTVARLEQPSSRTVDADSVSASHEASSDRADSPTPPTPRHCEAEDAREVGEPLTARASAPRAAQEPPEIRDRRDDDDARDDDALSSAVPSSVEIVRSDDFRNASHTAKDPSWFRDAAKRAEEPLVCICD